MLKRFQKESTGECTFAEHLGGEGDDHAGVWSHDVPAAGLQPGGTRVNDEVLRKLGGQHLVEAATSRPFRQLSRGSPNPNP